MQSKPYRSNSDVYRSRNVRLLCRDGLIKLWLLQGCIANISVMKWVGVLVFESCACLERPGFRASTDVYSVTDTVSSVQVTAAPP